MKIYAVAICLWLTLAFMAFTPAQDLKATTRDYRQGSEVQAPHPTISRTKDQTPDEQLGPWFADCQRRISRLLEREQPEAFSCTFKIDNAGQIGELKTLKSSGSDMFDRAVLDAIKAAQLRPPPQDDRLNYARTRGLKLEIISSDRPFVRVRLGPQK